MKWAAVKFDENSGKLKIFRIFRNLTKHWKDHPLSYFWEEYEYDGRKLHKKFILRRKVARSCFKSKSCIILKANTVEELKNKIEELIVLKEII
jgi:hypothetical protein